MISWTFASLTFLDVWEFKAQDVRDNASDITNTDGIQDKNSNNLNFYVIRFLHWNYKIHYAGSG